MSVQFDGNPPAQAWEWGVAQCGEAYAMVASEALSLDPRVQAAIAGASLLVAAVAASRSRNNGIVHSVIVFAAVAVALGGIGLALAWFVPQVLDPDSVVRHPVPTMH